MSPNDHLDTRLHRRMEHVAREQFEAAESEAALLAARQKTLADVAWEASHAGQFVRIEVGPRSLSGMPVYARNDLMTLEIPRGVAPLARAEVSLLAVDSITPIARMGKARPETRSVESFQARIGMLQLSDDHFEVVCRGGQSEYLGIIEYVARDHVTMETSNGRVFVALHQIAYLVRRLSVL